MATLIPLAEPVLHAPRRPPGDLPGSPSGSAPGAPAGFALWALGFRPFYLAAALLAAISVPLWALQVTGWLGGAYLRGPVWHAHEMLFGFALAVVTGFLFTAGQNWSGQPTPRGRQLMALAALWLAARVLVLTPWALAAALANVAFPLAAAWGLGRALWAGGNRRNYFFVALLALFSVAAGLVHAVQLGWLAAPGAAWQHTGLQAGLDVMLLIMAVMAGRVVPMFTNNGVPGAHARRVPWVEQAAIATPLLLLALELGLALLPAGAPALRALLGMAALAAALVHAQRLWLWQPWAARANPLVWVLHAAYAFIPLHLLLRALAAAGWLAPGAATHALTVGAIGTLCLGMMTRTARGHTGRPLRADRADLACYALVIGAALLRVLLPLAWPAAYGAAMLASALLWSAAFGLYALHYGPWLCRSRADGRPG
ncbi:NnrS family protein [Aquabacterium sp. OR-4]|uniref:NnrS family protein n=1 Tax=Aquabacterium sp. OR-4 TaxID=2978127 RepID=UPI0028C94720|nr:NnrS family protein [Aquabacterium sp. OR-4]MDT7835852.1 NnrS family protein [Aquabacterium sp. OR-4]